MAIQGPVGKENLDISFRLQSKSLLFDGSNNALLGARCNIVASASCHGIVFVGSQNAELFVACLRDLELAHDLDQNIPIRRVPLPAPTTQIAANCDSSLLAVAVKLNGTPHIQLYSTASFLTPNVQKIREFRLSTDNSDAIQLCWNPVINMTLALCTDSGGLNTYTLKEAGIEFHSIDPNLKAKCCCWSPKGKQIVVGFGNGKLMQFTPELKPAKAIECPAGVIAGSFDTIAIQWLSTFQFAVALLSHQPDSRPVLHIVNAPKAGPPQFIAYNDVCYSSTESRPSKIYLHHIMQWNMILVASANAIDVSFLRISQAGDLPVWTQEFPNDLYPANLPLTPTTDESFPIGFEFDTGCVNRLLQEDGNAYPVMPMLHILSTYGVLCSFYVLNTTPTYVDVCSPPRPLDPSVANFFKVQPAIAPAPSQPEVLKTPPKADMPFAPPIGQSTPSIPKVQPMPQKAPPSNSFFGLSNTSQPPPAFGASSAFQSVAKTTAPSVAPTLNLTQSQPPAQALITVPQTYTPAASAHTKPVESLPVVAAIEKQSTAEDEQVYSRMIQDEMKAFELELRTVLEKSRSLKVSIGTKEESAHMRRSIEELDELKKEATETIDSLRSDVQSNRLGLTEMFSMLYEARAKLDQSKNEKSIFMNYSQVQDRASKRTLDRLVKQVSQCEMQLHLAMQVMNSQWASYQEAISKSRKNRMHNPSLEGLYQTLTKQQEIIYRQNEKMAVLKSKLGLRENLMKQKSTLPMMESFSDSMISISLADQVESENSKLTNKKLKNLRNLLAGRDVVTIKPQRPERVGLSSEIIREKKLQTLKTIKKRQLTEPPTGINQVAVTPAARAPTYNQTAPVPFSQAASFPTFNQSTAPTAAPVFSLSASQQKTTFGLTSSTSQPQQQLSFGVQKKPDELPKPAPFSGFGASQAPSFGIGLSSGGQPSFGMSSASLVLDAEKKKEEVAALTPAPRLYLNPAAHKASAEAHKPPSTIANTNIAVSATFSIPLANKVAPTQKDQPRVVEKKQEEIKAPATSENASFTFKLSEKKDESSVVTVKAPSGNPSFSSLLSSTTDTSKGFSFAAGNAPSPFSVAPKVSDTKSAASSTSAAATTTASIFSGFGASHATTSAPGSIFGGTSTSFSGFGSGFSLGLGEQAKPSSNFSLNLGDASKAPSAAGSFSFAALAPSIATTTAADSKPFAAPASDVKSSFSFSSAVSQPSTTKSEISGAVESSTFSFANLGATITSSAAPVDLSKPENAVTSSVTITPLSSVDSVLQGQKICSPDMKPVAQSPPANIFGGSAAKTETTSIFSSSSFGSALGVTSTSPPFTSQATPLQVTSPLAIPTPTTTPTASIFASQVTPTTSAAAPSLFGSLSLGTSDASKLSPTSPPTGLFSSLVKPDQSVFAPTSPSVAPAAASPFGGGFSQSTFGTAAPSTNIFGAATTQAPGGSIFGPSQPAATQAPFGAQQGSIFGLTAASGATGGSLFSQSSFAAPATTAPTSIFGGSQAPQQSSQFGGASVFGSAQSPPQSTTGSIFGGQSSFGNAPSTAGGSIFGGGGGAAATSPFGSSSVFGGAPTFSNTFGGVGQSGFGSSAPTGSVFSQQAPAFGASPTFGGQATFGSPKSNIFGQAASGPSNNLFEQLGSQQSGNLFGNLAQNQQQQAQPPPQTGGGFAGSAFSSWR